MQELSKVSRPRRKVKERIRKLHNEIKDGLYIERFNGMKFLGMELGPEQLLEKFGKENEVYDKAQNATEPYLQ